MTDLQISTIALLLCLALVHGAQLSRPLWVRWAVNLVPPFFAPGLPSPSKSLTYDEEITVLDGALRRASR